MKAYNVYLNGKKIDTVFYTTGEKNKKDREGSCKDGLVNHDGYDNNIVVKESRKYQ